LKIFDRLTDIVKGKGLQIIFKDRAAAGQILADILKPTIMEKDHDEILVLGIPRGGVVVAHAVARKLHTDFDVVMPIKLRSPYKGNFIGAVMPNDVMYIDESKVRLLKVSPQHIENEKSEQLKEIERRMALYRPSGKEYKIKGRTVILVDDGIATGSTAVAAVRWLKKREPKYLIIAVPVANKQAVDLLKKEVERVEVITMPSNFVAISESYQKFEKIMDEQVVEILEKWRSQ
jgi:putative phosphoribosyl transferase